MNKIPSLFLREFNAKGRLVRSLDEVNPDCLWAAKGEGVATRKWDGTAVAIIGGVLHKRLDIKNMKEPPPGWIACSRLDGSKSKPGWFPVGVGPEDQWHREAWEFDSGLRDGTYELCGPRVGGNPERFERHALVAHGFGKYPTAPRTLAGLQAYLAPLDIEGLVFHHPDGRMAKVRKEDIGLKRRP